MKEPEEYDCMKQIHDCGELKRVRSAEAIYEAVDSP